VSRLALGARLLGAAGLAVLLAAAAPALAKKPLGPADRIDLNRAGVAELTRLPGVGEKKAQAIVAARSKKPFARPEDVVGVKGLGPAWFAKVKGHLVVGASAPAAATATAAPAPAAPVGSARK
jgi:competence protein ComEA